MGAISKALWSGINSQPIHLTNRSAFGATNFYMFFDRLNVTAALDKKEQRVLGGTGAFGRTAIRRSIRKAGKKKSRISKPTVPGTDDACHSGEDEAADSGRAVRVKKRRYYSTRQRCMEAGTAKTMAFPFNTDLV